MELDRTCSAEENMSDSRKEEGDGKETTMLLMPATNGCISAIGGFILRRKVQLNDRSSGNNLVEVLEFEPSDSSDFEDKFVGSHFSQIMSTYFQCISR